MIGLPDPLIVLAYSLCLLSTLLCVVYSWRNWNQGDDTIDANDVRWAKEEDARPD